MGRKRKGSSGHKGGQQKQNASKQPHEKTGHAGAQTENLVSTEERRPNITEGIHRYHWVVLLCALLVLGILFPGFWSSLHQHEPDVSIPKVEEQRKDIYSPIHTNKHAHFFYDAPFSNLKPLLPERKKTIWGTYMPYLYFGFSARTKDSPTVALIWKEDGNWYDFCNKDMAKYGWERHDGRNFGKQEILTKHYILQIEFLRITDTAETEWEIQITSTRKNNSEKVNPIDLYLQILDLQAKSASVDLTENYETPFNITFRTKELDEVHINELSSGEDMRFDCWRIYADSPVVAGKHLKSREYKTIHAERFNGFVSKYTSSKDISIVLHISNLPTTSKFSKDMFSKRLAKHLDTFDRRFDKVFPVRSEEFSDYAKVVAKIALSNLLGSIAFFPGPILVQRENSPEIIQLSEESLFVTIPSREYLIQTENIVWDEGFRNLVIGMWDWNISIDIICNWLDLLDSRGWIPHEQIINEILFSKTERNYIPKINNLTYPPTFAIPLLQTAQKLRFDEKYRSRSMVLKTIYDRTCFWFKHLSWSLFEAEVNTVPNHKDKNIVIDKNTNVHEGEKNDKDEMQIFEQKLWVAHSAQELYRLSIIIDNLPDINDKTMPENDPPTEWLQMAVNFLNKEGTYHFQINDFEDIPGIIVENSISESILPFILQLIMPDSDEIDRYLIDLENPEKFWTNYGLRSVFREFDKGRLLQQNVGSIQIKSNYMALRALNFYAGKSKQYKDRLRYLYKSVRKNLVTNVVNVFKQSGAFYEAYNGETGVGEGHYPYTGSTSLILLIISENYH